jgi:hypothetical protein
MTPVLTMSTPASKNSSRRNSPKKNKTNALRITSATIVAMLAISLASATRTLPEEAEKEDNHMDSHDSANQSKPESPKPERKPPLKTPKPQMQRQYRASTMIKKTISRFWSHCQLM